MEDGEAKKILGSSCLLLYMHPYSSNDGAENKEQVNNNNKKALLSQRRPRHAPNIWVP